MTHPDPTPQLTAALDAEPDLVDRIFECLMQTAPTLAATLEALAVDVDGAKQAVREEFGGHKHYVPSRRRAEESQRVRTEVLRLFNGRNASEVARVLKISRATVYRTIKQPGR